jgi:hypothetical protein
MGQSLTPFTRLTLLISELRDRKIAELIDVKKCDLAHHTGALAEELTEPAQKAAAAAIDEQGRSLLSVIREGDLTKAEEERKALLASCKSLKDLL